MDEWKDVAKCPLSAALVNKDQDMLSVLLVSLLSVVRSEEITRFASELLNTMEHDVQIWWNAECNCDGHQN